MELEFLNLDPVKAADALSQFDWRMNIRPRTTRTLGTKRRRPDSNATQRRDGVVGIDEELDSSEEMMEGDQFSPHELEVWTNTSEW